MASQSTFVLKADTSSFLKSIQEAQTRLLGIEKEASTSYQQILAAQAEVNRLQASQSDLGKLKATIDATSKARIAELSALQANADSERKKSLNEMIRLERALAASDKAKISEYMAGLQATEKGLQNQIKGLQLANAALKQNANEIQNINNKQAEQSVYAKKNIDAVKARQALLQEEQEKAKEASKQQLEQIRARVEANKAEWATIKRVNEEEKQRLLLKQRLAIQDAESDKLKSNSMFIVAQQRLAEKQKQQELAIQAAREQQKQQLQSNLEISALARASSAFPATPKSSPAIPLLSATATQNIKPIDSSSIIRFREETQKATEAIREQTKATSLADEGFARLNRSFQGFAAGYLGFSAIVGQTKEIVDASVKFDTLNKIFTAITGSGEVAAAEMDMVKEAADRLGVPVLKSAQGLKGLLAVGLTLQEPMANLNQQFVALSQAAVSFGMGEVEVERAFKAYTQILSKDKLMAEELTGQLAEAIPGAVGIMAKALGYVTKTGLPDTAKLFKEMEKGAIDGSDALNKFSVELKKVTDAMVPTAAQSARAEFTRFQNSLLELRATIGESGLLEMLADLAKVGTSVFSGIDTKDIADLTTHIKVLGSAVGIGLVAHFLKTKESATAFSGALKDVAHSVVSGMDIQTKATLQTANANNALLLATKPLTASQVALRHEIMASAIAGEMATNKITAYNQSVASVGRASAIATSATNLLSISLRGVAAAASFAWPIAVIMAATDAYITVQDSIKDTTEELDNLANSGSWGQLATKIRELNTNISDMQDNSKGFWGSFKQAIANNAIVFEENKFAALIGAGYSEYDKILAKKIQDKRNTSDEYLKQEVAHFQEQLRQIKDRKGAGADPALVSINEVIKKLNIEDKRLTPEEYTTDIGKLVKAKEELEDIVKKNQDKLSKSKKPDGKDLSSALIKSAKSEFEAIKEMSETAFKQMEMLNELPTADLEMYKSLAKVQLEILQNEKEISILRAAKDDKGDKAIEIKALLDKNKALKQSEESIYKINQITKEKATNEYLAANATELQIPIIKEAMDIQKAYEKALLDGVDATVALTIANDKWAKSYASNDFSKMQSLLEIQKEIAEVTLRGREKDRELENIRHLEAINNLEKEKSQLSAMDKESIDRINLRIALENERYKQNTDLTIRYMNIAFDTLEKNIDDTLFNVLTGKFEDFGETIKNIFTDVATQIAKDLTGSIASSITGGLKSIASEMLGSGGSLFNVGLAELTSSTPSFSSFTDFTEWANANGEGVDTKLLAQATELAQGGDLSGAANLLGTASNAYSLATLPSKAKNLLAFASDPSGYFTTLGSTTGGFLGNVSTGFGGWLGGYTAPAANSAMGLGYYGGGALAGAGGGYLLGTLGDRVFGKQTQAGLGGAIGGAAGALIGTQIGSIGGPLGAVIGAGIGSVVGGMFGGGKKYTGGGSQIILADSRGYSWTANGANVSGNFGEISKGNVAGWDMSWKDWKKSGGWFSSNSKGTEHEISGMSDEQISAINKVFGAYEAILRGFGSTSTLTMQGGTYASISAFADATGKETLKRLMNIGALTETITQSTTYTLSDAFKNGIDGVDWSQVGKTIETSVTRQTADGLKLEKVYAAWSAYAAENKKTVTEALTEGLNGAISFMLDFSLLNAQLSGGNVLKLKAQQTADALATTQEALGIFGVSVANFSAQMQSAIKENATPETIQSWQALGTALQAAAEAQKAYQDAIEAINKTFIAAANEITGAGKKTFDQLSAMTPTMDNYNELIGMLRETRQADIDTLTTISQKRIESLEKEKAFIVDMSEIAKELNSRIFEGAPANNVLFKTEVAKAKQAIAAGQLPDTSILAKTANEYLDTYAKFSKSREDYIFEVAKVRSELGGIKTKESTISDVEAAIKKEEETLKSAIDNLNSTALKILESWRGRLIGNEGAIRDAIGGGGMVNVINMAPLVPFADGGIVTSATNALIGEAGYPEAIIPLKDGNGLKVDISGLTPLLEELITKQGATEQTMNRIKTLLERVARLDKGAISVMQVA